MEIIKLRHQNVKDLSLFLIELRNAGLETFFAPHPFDETSIHQIIDQIQRDIYLLVYFNERLLGYGILRGWDEGFAVPSLGIAISQEYQGHGLGRSLMNWLHLHATLCNAKSIRLRVHHLNMSAINLYKSLNYQFKEDHAKPGYLLGELNLGAA